MTVASYLGGMLAFCVMLAGVCAGAILLTRRRTPDLTGAARPVALALLITFGLLCVHIVPGALGVLGLPGVLVATGLWLAAAASTPALNGPKRPSTSLDPPAPGNRRPPAEAGRIAWVVALLGVGAVVLFTLAYLRDQLVVAPGSIDILNFHLPGVGRWIQTGSIWGINEFVADLSPGRYPANGDVLLLAATLPWKSDFLAHLVPYPYYVLTGFSAYACARELGAPGPSSAAAGALVLAIPAVAVPALTNSFPDVVLLFGLAAGLLFLLRHRRTGGGYELVLAGLALGVAFGSKWYGVSTVAIVVGVWAISKLVERRDLRLVIGQGAILAGLIALAGGFWMLRNWIQSGNPVYPVEVVPFGLTIFAAPVDTVRVLAGETLAGYIGASGIWGEAIWPQLREALAWPGLLIAAGSLVVVGSLLTATGRASPRRRLIAVGLVIAASLVVAYSITPYTAGGGPRFPALVGPNARYVVPAMLVGALLLAWASGVFRWGPALFSSLGLVAIADGLRISSQGVASFATLELDDWLIAAALTFAIAGIVLVARSLSRRSLGPRPVAVVAILALLAAVAVGYRVQNSFLENRYRGSDPTADWLIENAPSGHRVGIAGNWTNDFSPVLPAFGPRFGNEVEYVGPFVRETLRTYTGPEEYTEALERGGYDYLVVGLGIPPRRSAPEGRWAIRAGFEPVISSETLSLLRAPD